MYVSWAPVISLSKIKHNCSLTRTISPTLLTMVQEGHPLEKIPNLSKQTKLQKRISRYVSNFYPHQNISEHIQRFRNSDFSDLT